MSQANEAYADWCDQLANDYVNEANVLSDYGLDEKAKISIGRANDLYAEARLIRSGAIYLDDFATLQFLNRKTRH